MAATNTTTTWEPPSSIVGGYNGDSANIHRIMMAFAAISWYNAAELIFLILVRFKHYKGLYFWSLMVTAWAIIIYQIGVWGKMENIAAQTLITQTLDNVGWVLMILGNSIVLYSRLHLITQDRLLLNLVLYGILINTLCMYVPTTTLDYGCNVRLSRPYCNGYNVMERIQMTMFSLQEFAISGVYLVEAYKFLRAIYAAEHEHRRAKRLMWELFAVNVALIALDVALLSVEYVNLYEIEVTLKGLVYSLKLKLEMGVLSRLVHLVTDDRGIKRTATFQDGMDWEASSKRPSASADHLERRPRLHSNARSRSRSISVPWLTRVRSADVALSPTTTRTQHKHTDSSTEASSSPTTSDFRRGRHLGSPKSPPPASRSPLPALNMATDSYTTRNSTHTRTSRATDDAPTSLDFVTVAPAAVPRTPPSLGEEIDAELGAMDPSYFDHESNRTWRHVADGEETDMFDSPARATLRTPGRALLRPGSSRSLESVESDVSGISGIVYPGRLPS